MIKKLLMSLAATTMVASPLLATQAQAAPHREVTRVVKHSPHGRASFKQKTVYKQKHVVRKNDNRRWAKGQRFDRRDARNYRVVNNYRDYRLNAPPRGYHWVRSGNDAVLVAITSGIIGAVIGSVIR
ncbi:RcnB family protein [Sphingobium vermicomposti]|uniref:Ni/Co efflux regulator RcnB n=1 Tax=Sphingobium vermicomposti TaxID=529005 RepID=A0A846M7T2_9SPHN|nr:RcnB family protein [Sphingobium vermicomposti]NIJ16750.1 Ni/Co efflux regulator RcnB [Sphingobium vermicomposti]